MNEYAGWMPSYRVTLSIGALRPGVAPPDVLPAAGAAAAEVTELEASELSVVAGEARITVRFSADDAELAEQVAAHVGQATARLAAVVTARLTERVGARWYPVSSGR
ncbi:hypothetical protein [Homoserinimonas sp. OAct 916]|uniref:hypothetical protein n=1 Tax=Homoserinimonas sp. OAct 916 TaxID=2211450 RepID=UPI001E635318|nr:hypothetical protein [Homoserinimonas sp. OAct 916]